MAAPVDVSVAHGSVTDTTKEYCERKLLRALEHAPVPVLHVRAYLDTTGNPAVERAVAAGVTVDLNGRVVRAHVVGATWREAIDLLEDKLRHELEQIRGRRHARRMRSVEGNGEGEWRHGDIPTHRPAYYPRAQDDRQVVERQTWLQGPMSVGDALAQLTGLGHQFALFTEQSSGVDAVVALQPDSTVVLTMTGVGIEGVDGVTDRMEVRSSVPHLHVDEAIRTLDVGALPYVFFVDAASGRGAVLHRRYDGHLGLVTAAG